MEKYILMVRYIVLLLALLALLNCKGQTAPPLGVGDNFPGLTLEDMAGQQVDFSGVSRAKMTLVSIRTIGCRFCASDFVELERLYQDYNRDELDVTVINVAVERSSVQEFLAGKNISFPILIDQEMAAMHQTHVVILPVAYLMDQNRIILARLTGGFSSEEIASLIKNEVGKGQ